MKDQWSGKTLRALRLTKLAEPNRSSISLAVLPAICSSAIRRYPRSQKLGPTGSWKSSLDTR